MIDFVAVARTPRKPKAKDRQEPGLGTLRLDAGEARTSAARAPAAEAPRRPKAPGRSWRKRIALFLLKWLAILGAWGVVAAVLLLVWFAHDLPDISGIDVFNRRPSITVTSAQGEVLGTYGDLHGGVVELREMPPHLPRALLATEDRRFYSHFGLDVVGLARASVVNMRAGRVVQGGSTITQQLAKNVFLTHERSIRRKAQETILALWLERRFTKDQILTLYLNRVYLGAGTYGVEAASRRYFGKSVRQVNRREAALLVGLLKAPSRYAPTTDLDRASDRADEVLVNMMEAGFLTETELEIARRDPIRLAAGVVGNRGGRYFADWVVDQVPGFLGYLDRDVTVVTTLDSRLQRTAEDLVAGLIQREGAKAHVSQAALVSMTPDGAIRAMVGGVDYGDSQFNRATLARRQPGSTFKPIVYLAAVERGLTPEDRVLDAPITIRDWSPKNFEPGYRGSVTAREALARSLNTAAVRVAQQTGPERIVALARRIGLGGEMQPNLSIALGTGEVTPLELTAAFATFANGGNGVWPYTVAEIRDAGGRVLYRRAGSGPGRVIERGPLGSIVDMMQAVMQSGTGRSAALDRPAAGKTGTSQDFRDAWFVGFTADVVTGVWLGNDDRTPMKGVTGGSLPAQLWKAYMTEAHRGVPAKPLPGRIAPAGQPAAAVAGSPWQRAFQGGRDPRSLDPTQNRFDNWQPN